MLTSVNELCWWMTKWTTNTFLDFTDIWSVQNRQNGCTLQDGIFCPLYKPYRNHPTFLLLLLFFLFFIFFISTRQNFLQARIHTSHLHTGARKCIPAARLAIWWQAVGGREDELCQWQPLKRTTHSPVAGEAWWMIISRCDRCGIGRGALTFRPFLPTSSIRLSFSLFAYLGQYFRTPLAWLYWHTPDSVWWLMSIWEPLSPSLAFTFCLSLLGRNHFLH